MSKYDKVDGDFYKDSKESDTYIDSLNCFLEKCILNDKHTEINCEIMTYVPVTCLFHQVINNYSKYENSTV